MSADLADAVTPFPVHVAMCNVMQAIGAIGKSRTNTHQNFKFRGIDDVMNALHEPLTSNGVFYVPEVLESEYTSYTTSNGTGMRNAVLKVRFTFYGPAGDSVSGVGMGEASDSGDKATSKALAMALKYMLLQTFCIPTEEAAQDDPDGQAHSRAGDAWAAPSSEPSCPTCGSQVWDNTEDPHRGKRPKWKCKNKSCDWVSWADDPFEVSTPKGGDPVGAATAPSSTQERREAPSRTAPGGQASQGSSKAASGRAEPKPADGDAEAPLGRSGESTAPASTSKTEEGSAAEPSGGQGAEPSTSWEAALREYHDRHHRWDSAIASKAAQLAVKHRVPPPGNWRQLWERPAIHEDLVRELGLGQEAAT